jgi:hypothetical protein
LAERLYEDGFVLLRDREGQAGNLPLGHRCVDQRFEIVQHVTLAATGLTPPWSGAHAGAFGNGAGSDET